VKTCPDCRKSQPYDAFHKNRRTKDGRSTYCVPCALARKKRERDANLAAYREKEWASKVRAKYGISTEEYQALLDAQGGACAICRSTSTGARTGRFCVDHDHDTGRIRGLLCDACNRGIGYLGDTHDAVQRAAGYLRKAEEATP
jgi:hypothetical protein